MFDTIYALGYPAANGDPTWERYFDDKYTGPDAKFYVSLWTNGRSKWFKNTKTAWEQLGDIVKNGNQLSRNIGYNSFIDKPGITDSMVALPINGDKFFKYRYFPKEGLKGSKILDDFDLDPKVSDNYDGDLYYYGLRYIIRHYAPAGGASGSSVRNQKNEIIGLLDISNGGAGVGLVTSLRSEGVNYNGYYGSYNMEAYDLIYGGGPNQRTSYREALMHLYKNENFKTNLFKNGLNQIPEEYKFSKNYGIDASMKNDTKELKSEK